MTGRMCAAAAQCCSGGRETFFQNALLLVYSNIRPARSQHTHALRLTSRWAPAPLRLLPGRDCLASHLRCLAASVPDALHSIAPSTIGVGDAPSLPAAAALACRRRAVCHNCNDASAMSRPATFTPSRSILAGSPECPHMFLIATFPTVRGRDQFSQCETLLMIAFLDLAKFSPHPH